MSLAIVKCLMKNPNPRGGCVCSPHGKRGACTPPYLCFTASEMHDPRNPHVVVGFPCMEAAMRKAENTSTVKSLRAKNAPAPAPEPAPKPVELSIEDALRTITAALPQSC